MKNFHEWMFNNIKQPPTMNRLPEQISKMSQEGYKQALEAAADTKQKQDYINGRITLHQYKESELDFITELNRAA